MLLSKIKIYFYGVIATIFALLLAIIGMQRQAISRKDYDALRKEKDEQKARANELERRATAQAKAAAEAQERREKAETSIRDGRRDYFERGQ